ncbi:MAG: VOC family protein [Planctomycetes bacterium]|nr:VOC family protein [Planctomycetota bacterium]
MNLSVGPMCRIVLLVRDFAKSLAFYRDVLGLEPQGPIYDGWAVLKTGGPSLCLRGPWPGMPFSAEKFGSSPDEILFRVSSAEETRRRLIERGVAVKEIHSPGPGIRVAEFADPDGRRLGVESSTI